MRSRRYSLVIAAATLLLLSCAASTGNKPAELSNPYMLKAENHTDNGMAAMQQERWDAAIRSFSRALTAAQLADDTSTVTHSWYNLASAQSSAGLNSEAEASYAQVMQLAQRHQDEVMQLRAQLALHLMQQRLGRLPDSFSLQQLPESLFTKQQWPADLHLQAARLAQRLGKNDAAADAYQLLVKRNKTKASEYRMAAEAHMGLALLARDNGENQRAVNEAEQALSYCRRIGAPRLTAHALLLQGELAPEKVEKRDKLERALDIYIALNDHNGQKKALSRLLATAEASGDEKGTEQLRLRLTDLEDKLGE
ncbi:tetratricopeptide repeat protein [Mariprofundus sp. KV]|uniref:tetratricopeptide repeat protein n=1 Tax=Mariprofundus sp. KV TaxID=2608715 RepID=UPI00159FD73E|nr:hypothetical protein [Mariprofundus sp. KV]